MSLRRFAHIASRKTVRIIMSNNSKYTEREHMFSAQPSGGFLPFSDGFLPFPFRG